jgi:hypothetical protein
VALDIEPTLPHLVSACSSVEQADSQAALEHLMLLSSDLLSADFFFVIVFR